MSSDCEWMFGDAATGALGFNELSHLNPFRWSGPTSFEKAIYDLEDVLKVGSRSILAKVPAGIQTKSRRFETTEEAIAYLKKKDPVELVRKQDAEKGASEAVKVASAAKDAAEAAVAAARGELATKKEVVMQAKAGDDAANDAVNSANVLADTIQSEFGCEWRFGTVGVRKMGFSTVELNPLRWSGNMSIRQGILQLQTVQAEAADRKIVVKVPGGIAGKEQRFQTPCKAIAFLEGVCPLRNQARDALEAAKVEQKTANARLSDAEADAVETQVKLELAIAHASWADANLEVANRRAVQAKAELDEISSTP